MDRQRAIVASTAYQAGDPERMMARMKAGFISQGKEGIVKARAVEDQLMRDTWQAAGYDLLPKLGSLRVPTLVIAAAERIAQAIPDAEVVTIKDCGHFAFLECPDEVRDAFKAFFLRPQ